MSEENFGDGAFKKRNVLGDVTNFVGKRAFSAISGDVGCGVENWIKGDSDKKVCLGVENVEVLDSLVEGVLNDKYRDKGLSEFSRSCSCPEVNELKDYNSLVISKADKECNRDKSLKKNFEHCRVDYVCQSVGDIWRELDSPDVGGSEPKDERIGSQGEQSTNMCGNLDKDVGENDENELGDDNMDSTKSEFTDYLRFPESQESGSSDLERCVGVKGDGLSDSPVGVDLIKACSCSFCTKAAYIWSDLHYQDIKGRLAAIRKSQKEANILVQRSTENKAIDIHGPGKPDVKLQSSLMDHWRSLFLNMEDIYGQESSQLESSLYTLRDLRDDCKTELESINGMLSEKH
ncbi:hypothetical protein POM88_011018 [Heracleum sosnowskyi]|uniref:Uncharacterized protein n=1 Tax=Heracleum sosnowskyi TaxID=360622 RepID=A0AAD8IX63_9APIA|nr:hypothetical protein POM88_011018 [Heracleum sosnowskyi]